MANRFAGRGDSIKDSGVQKWLNIFGDVQVINNIGRLKNKMQRKIARKAIAKALKPIERIARSNAPEDSGLLKKAIKSKVTRMVSGKVYVDPKVFAMKSANTGGEKKIIKVAGPARKMGYRDIVKNLKKHNPDAMISKPAAYAHLVEFGTKKIRPRPFMRPALAMGRNAAINAIAKEVKQELTK